jgi:UDP-N-acetylmuramoyl-tripeptide--D-alanyl-D-alanine ligase
VSAFVLTAGLVADVVGGRLAAGTATQVIDSVVTDSRTMRPVMRARDAAGAMFVALSGPNFDGHNFLSQAVAMGAAALLVSQLPADSGSAAVILVDDVLAALQRLGHAVRVRSGTRVVAITGSAGKTTTKEATATLLASRYQVFRNVGNLNNHIGLPLSLIELRHGPDMAVLELGMNHAGEIRLLTSLAQPDVRVWTNVGNAHIGHFGSAEAIAAAKAEILDGATANTLIVANADDALVMQHVRAVAHAKVLTFGQAADADVRATGIVDRGFDGVTANVTSPLGDLALAVKLPGLGNLSNVLAAVTVALAHDVQPRDVEREVAALAPVARRGASGLLRSGVRLVDDSYNASPAAVIVALQALAATPVTGRRIAVLGEMRELGDDALLWHERCGRAAAEADVDVLVAVGGPAADGLVSGARSAGLSAEYLHRFATSGEAAAAVAGLVVAGDVVLVKGSRGTRTDIVADHLKAVA